VMEVAARCGFAEPSHFARRFCSRYGLSPLEFRRRS
jgi:AraC-like DNA-binding protein